MESKNAQRDSTDMAHEIDIFNRAQTTLKQYYASSQGVGAQNYGQQAMNDLAQQRGSTAMSLLEKAKSLIQDDKNKLDLAERNSMLAYNDYIASNKDDQTATENQRDSMVSARITIEEALQNKNEDLVRRQAMDDALIEQRKSLDEQCNQLLNNYADRKQARAADREYMVQAQATLEVVLARPYTGDSQGYVMNMPMPEPLDQPLSSFKGETGGGPNTFGRSLSGGVASYGTMTDARPNGTGA